MAQHDYVIANASGATVRADINSMALAISSNNSGSSEPATKYAYEFWVDSGNNLIKLRNGANNAWITLPLSTTASNTVDVNGGTIDGTTIGASSASTIVGTTIVANTSVNIAGDGATVTGIKDEDNMASNSAVKLATQQSIKAYVDAQIDTTDTLAEILAIGNTTTTAQKIQFRDSAIYINSSADGQLDLVADTEIQIAATTVDVNGAMNVSGSVGIGTASPDGKLHVFLSDASITPDADADDFIIEGNGASGMTIGSSASSVGSIRFADSGSPRAGMIYYHHVGNEMRFYTGATERVRIDSSGNLSLGHTTSTGAKFAICDGANAQIQFFPEVTTDTNLIQHYDVTSTTYMNADYRAATHKWTIGASEKMRLDASGNLGIGVTPEANWRSTVTAIDLGATGAFWDGHNYSIFANNVYEHTDTNRKHKQAGFGSSIEQYLGTISFNTTTSGSADATISGSTTMFLNTDGKVGIGITTPSTKLSIASGTNGTNAGDGITFYGTAVNNQAAIKSFNAGAYNGDLRFYTSEHSTASTAIGAERMRIDSSGRLGVGTTSPAKPLSVYAGDASGNVILTRAGTSENITIGTYHITATGNDLQLASSAGMLNFSAGGAERARIASDGITTIGMTATTGAATVRIGSVGNASANGTGNLEFVNSSSFKSWRISAGGTPDGALAFTQSANYGQADWTTERMRLNASNVVLVGKTATDYSTPGMELHTTGLFASSRTDNPTALLNRQGSHGTILLFRHDNSDVGTVSTNGSSLPSDRNFKREISNLDLGLNLITKLKPSQYNYKIDKDDCPKMYGLIAQDLEESLTEIGIEKNSTWLLQHSPNDDDKQSDYQLDYLKLTPILIKAIQEQQEQIELLTTEINNLKGE